jgi:hypothetical protein
MRAQGGDTDRDFSLSYNRAIVNSILSARFSTLHDSAFLSRGNISQFGTEDDEDSCEHEPRDLPNRTTGLASSVHW